MKWEKVEIGKVSKVISGFAFKSKDFQSIGTPIVKIKSIKDENIILDESDCVDSAIEVPIRFHLSKGDILISLTGSHITLPSSVVGRVARYRHETNSYLNQRAGKFINIDDERCHKDYLFYFLLQKETLTKIANKAQGAANQANISPGDVEGVEINLPPLPTQRKIASTLSAYDDLIENNLKRIKLLEESININYKNLISIEGKNFINVKLNSFVDIISGFPFKSNYYNENGKHKIVTIKNVQDGFFVPIVTDRIDDVPDNMNRALFLSTGDVIMSLTGNVGRVCLVYGDDYVLNQRVVKLSAKELIDQSFIYALLRDKQMLTILENLSNGTAQQNLSPIKMGELPIRYPSSNLRKDFHRKVSPMIEMICKLNIQNTKLREARDILLPKLMSGQIEV